MSKKKKKSEKCPQNVKKKKNQKISQKIVPKESLKNVWKCKKKKKKFE